MTRRGWRGGGENSNTLDRRRVGSFLGHLCETPPQWRIWRLEPIPPSTFPSFSSSFSASSSSSSTQRQISKLVQRSPLWKLLVLWRSFSYMGSCQLSPAKIRSRGRVSDESQCWREPPHFGGDQRCLCSEPPEIGGNYYYKQVEYTTRVDYWDIHMFFFVCS